MADNYLERKMDEYSSLPLKRKKTHELFSLLRKNRSYRGYDASFIVRRDQLERIISVNELIASARNQQVLRFRMVLKDEAEKVTSLCHFGGALPDLHLPVNGSEPNAYIVICTTVEAEKYVYMDLGISAQSMLLAATEIGLSGLCIGAFSKDEIKKALNLNLEPLLVIAIGKGSEKIELRPIREKESHKYYRIEGTHYVPKICLEDLII
ncbi:MAG: nitroreductase family protein [Alistipes sp.]|nr:nitroreductase family protein [Candidatus Alistipes equi]